MPRRAVEGSNGVADSYLDPEAIAQSYLHVVQQPQSGHGSGVTTFVSGSEVAALLRASQCG